MINQKIVYKILGSLLFIEAALMFWCLAVALYYQEDDIPAFLASVIITLFVGLILRFLGRNSDNTLSRRDSYLVVTLSWVIFSLIGTLPFLISGYIDSFTDAYFETMSGFTTTGATIIDDVDSFPHGLLFWRSLTQWIGGLGIVFFTIAILPSMVGGSTKIFAAEATGPIKSKLHPRISTGAKWIWMVYLCLTIACVVSFMVCGMGLFDAVNHAMASTATGGFSTHTASMAYFHSPTLDYVCALFCFLSGVNFTLLYRIAIHRDFKGMYKNSEFRFYFILVACFIAFITAELVFRSDYDFAHALRSATFTVVSFTTTTGLSNDDAGTWPHVTWVVLAAGMFFGACSGSTSGGVKGIRGVMLLKSMRNEFRQMLHPNAVLPMQVDGVNVSRQKRLTLLAFVTTYLAICLITSFVMIAMGIDNTNAITITLSCMGNVGPTLGLEIGPTMSWSILPDAAKWMCSFDMLVGRLEIFSVLVLLTPAFWNEN